MKDNFSWLGSMNNSESTTAAGGVGIKIPSHKMRSISNQRRPKLKSLFKKKKLIIHRDSYSMSKKY